MHYEWRVECKGLGLLQLVYAVAPCSDLLDLMIFELKFGTLHLDISYLCPEAGHRRTGLFSFSFVHKLWIGFLPKDICLLGLILISVL